MTEYNPLPRHRKKKWLLTDGRIVEEPPLEQSSEGRRVRVTGTTKSVYKKDLDDLIYRSVTQFAEKQGERVWMAVTDDDPVREVNAAADAPKGNVSSHLLAPRTNNYLGRSTTLSWTFRHESLPIAATIVVTMRDVRTGYGGDKSGKQVVESKVYYPSTSVYDAHTRTWHSSQDRALPYADHSDGSTEYDQGRQKFNDLIRDHAPEWLDELLGTTTYENEREAAAGVAKLCRRFEDYDEITIPDLRDPDEPSWLTLGLYETTYTRDFLKSLVEFINGQPVVEELFSLWTQMVTTFRRAGIVVDELTESDFHAVLSGDTERVNVTTPTINSDDPSQAIDNEHYVGFNLATGTITVSCRIRDTKPSDVATDYEIARIRAEAQGELDAFLGFQSNYLDYQHEELHQRAIEKRTVADDGLDELVNS